MENYLKGKSFLTLKYLSAKEIHYLLELAKNLKAKKKNNIKDNLLEGKNIALIFEKPSTRTRCAFSVAAYDEGAHGEYLSTKDIQLGAKESIEDTARVLGRMYDGIAFRGFSHDTVEKLAQYANVPVWNALTDSYHPTQILADFLTILEHLGTLKVKFVYLGDGRNNMANSLMIGAAKMGMDFVIACPTSLQPEEDLIAYCKNEAEKSGGTVTITEDVNEAAKNADVVYTDVWASMGEEEQLKDRISILKPYQVNKELMQQAKEKAIFMHCLPAVKGNEVTEDVFEAHADVIFDEAENRMHTIKAVMVATIKGASI